MSPLRVYSRQGCHLCEVLIEELLQQLRGRLSVDVCDIDSRADWRDKYGVRVPVVEYENKLISEYPLDCDAISRLLASLPDPRGE